MHSSPQHIVLKMIISTSVGCTTVTVFEMIVTIDVTVSEIVLRAVATVVAVT